MLIWRYFEITVLMFMVKERIIIEKHSFQCKSCFMMEITRIILKLFSVFIEVRGCLYDCMLIFKDI